MKKIIGFFSGVAILVLAAASIHVCVRVYNYADAQKINAIMLQPATLRQNRIPAPIALENISDEYIRNRLIIKFAMEYLQVMPDIGELETRAGPQGALRLMSAPAVVSKWKSEVMPELKEMADKRKMRTITARPKDIEIRGKYYVVPFRAKTWNTANDFNSPPIISSGQELYLQLRFNKKIRETLHGREFSAGKFLDNGMPPAAIFEFMVDEVIIK
ncbi:MAG: hypothetical protein LBD94_00925 [Rickettsiales bacterium]|jgi:hypothetical protein|nr:hypothetical protein [Rickettsiales bacterium]